MEKTYEYDNAIVIIEVPEDISRIQKATEVFIKKVMKEGKTNGNINKTRSIREE